jgi:hypothetical protein
MQMVRLLRSFDGKRRWNFDVNRDGENDLAGDFNGDGVVDLGGPDVPIYVSGASLGGILSSLMGGIEPDIDAIAPVLPGGYLSEIGTRSDLGQVQNPLVLRMMGPLFLVHPNDAGKPALFQMVPDVVKNVQSQIAELPAGMAELKEKKIRELRLLPNPIADKKVLKVLNKDRVTEVVKELWKLLAASGGGKKGGKKK